MGADRSAPLLRRIPVATPAAGVDWARLNDSGGYWLIRSVAFRLTASAVAATRFPHLRAAGGDDEWFATTVNRATFANQSRLYCGFPGADVSVGDADIVTVSWPHDGLILPPGHTLRSQVQSIDVGDTLTGVVLTVVEYPETLPINYLPLPYMIPLNDQE